mmetsp:Transcript_16898/g.25462  ORF Transcript_16898/g.25462 Transcript_16898/m.25462 type:complete len:690 (+) Transcript_16898:303-2372(+)|eukprot:CAMPEP_0185025696 /NCGR_PEP_ID=MMETSP1103-20130426/8849_1 /TAXON_ID=36769 /ORGANISM="Paraphysomonas bandaiensis, Strain Caron Lab Isolate" /LENGTH=689 /DNA_ID=CAMNT_0027558975 /DNA_START=208 /DNA_END=2277 /DNA_ORIENTATION=+
MGNDQSSTSRPSRGNPSGSTSNQSRVSAAASSDSGTPPPGAYNIPGQPRNQRFYVTIPRGVRPGMHFAVLVNGQQMMVRCPPDHGENDRLIVTAPRQQSQQYVVTVPSNVRPGEQFRVMINNQEVMVTCPPGVRPSQRVTFQLPQQERTSQPAPNHQMFEVAVPDGVRPGQPFALLAHGQRVMVTCPPNVRPGQKIRFQLPMQLSQQQLEAIRVDYDKDGWMRCLGQDLKFHWVYNTSSTHSTSEKHRVPFDVNSTAYVRELVIHPSSKGPGELNFIEASKYAMATTVPGTDVNYQALSSVAQLPFQQKSEWLKNQFTAIRVPWEEGHIKLKIRRSSLLQDSMESVESIQSSNMHKILRVEFIGEPGLDAGGVTREWYNLVADQLFNPDCGLFLYSSVNQMCMQVNPNSGIANEYHLRYFHFAGRVLGKALMDGQITPVHLVQPLYKHLMGFPVTLRDLEHIDDDVYRNLMELLDLDDVSMLYLDFTVTEDQLGMTHTVALIEGGEDIPVTNDNIVQYLEEQLKYRLLGRIRDQLREFLKGFYDVVPEPLLAVFDFQELELLLHGLPNINMDDWVTYTEYSGEFNGNPNHKVIQWFWEIVRSYSQENKAKLLQFSTGTCGVPAQGFAFLQGNDGNIRKFTLHGDKNVKVFPRSHTCFNRIDMPLYSSKSEMQKYLTMAITYESQGFEIE